MFIPVTFPSSPKNGEGLNILKHPHPVQLCSCAFFKVMNMLIGVLVEVVSVTAQVDKEETAMKALWFQWIGFSGKASPESSRADLTMKPTFRGFR